MPTFRSKRKISSAWVRSSVGIPGGCVSGPVPKPTSTVAVPVVCFALILNLRFAESNHQLEPVALDHWLEDGVELVEVDLGHAHSV